MQTALDVFHCNPDEEPIVSTQDRLNFKPMAEEDCRVHRSASGNGSLSTDKFWAGL
jgi:hypothetical protein